MIGEMLEAKKTLKQIAAKTGFSKSAIHRHAQGCVRIGRIRREKYNPERRVLTHNLTNDKLYRIEDKIIPANEVECEDVVLEVIFSGSPQGIAFEEPQEAPQQAEPPAEPPTVNESENIAPEPPAPQQSPSSETIEPSCKHEMRKVSGDMERCIHCGCQSQPYHPVGLTFDQLKNIKKRHSRFAI